MALFLSVFMAICCIVYDKNNVPLVLFQLQQRYVLYVVRMREHVYRLQAGDAVGFIQQLQVAGLGGGVAAYVHHLGCAHL